MAGSEGGWLPGMAGEEGLEGWEEGTERGVKSGFFFIFGTRSILIVGFAGHAVDQAEQLGFVDAIPVEEVGQGGVNAGDGQGEDGVVALGDVGADDFDTVRVEVFVRGGGAADADGDSTRRVRERMKEVWVCSRPRKVGVPAASAVVRVLDLGSAR